MASSAASAPVIVWFRDDLRLSDNPALHRAVQSGGPLLSVYVFDEESPGLRQLGGAARWWLHHSLAGLEASLEKLGGKLVILRGRSAGLIEKLAEASAAQAIFWNRRYGKPERDIDADIKSRMKDKDLVVESFNGNLLHEPWTIANKSGGSFKVFSAFWRAAQSKGEPEAPLPSPRKLSFAALPKMTGVKLLDLADLDLLPTKPDWAGGLRKTWKPGETGAKQRLRDFLADGLKGYSAGRDFPAKDNSSHLSPYLRFGNISPRQIWHAGRTGLLSGDIRAGNSDLEKFFSELGWREFDHHLLYHQPDLASVNFNRRFDDMPWRKAPKALKAWQQGLTGYPIVDAGMRELWHTGFMHNRVRMVVASFLIKHLLIDWREGEDWFWDTLVDADPANNPANWQWVAGSGADAAPYFRIFNPVLQGEKFDPDGVYVKRWVPELAHLPASLVHKPWTAGKENRDGNYPAPIVDHGMARVRALEALKSLRS